MPYFLAMQSTLKITAKGQITLKKKVLDELGLRPGDRVTVDVTGPGKAELKAAKHVTSFKDYFGMLASPDNPKLSIEEINEIIRRGWAGELEDNG